MRYLMSSHSTTNERNEKENSVNRLLDTAGLDQNSDRSSLSIERQRWQEDQR